MCEAVNSKFSPGMGSCGFNLCLIFIVIIYLIIGGAIFCAIERPKNNSSLDGGDSERRHLDTLAVRFIERYPGIPKESVQNLISDALSHSHKECQQMMDNASIWESLSTGVYYSGSIITTIGYGNVVPKTPLGQWMTILYGFFGIPLNVFMLANLGNSVGRQVSYQLRKFLSSTKCSIIPSSKYYLVEITSMLTFGVVVHILIPAAIVMKLEGWTFTESTYFSFVTLSTIGFGDYMVTGNPEAVYSEYVNLYRLVFLIVTHTGLAWASTLMALVINICDDGVKNTAKRKKNCLDSPRILKCCCQSRLSITNRQTSKEEFEMNKM